MVCFLQSERSSSVWERLSPSRPRLKMRTSSRRLVTVLGWAPALWRVALLGALVLACAIVADSLLQRRWALVRDLAVACDHRRRAREPPRSFRRRRLAPGRGGLSGRGGASPSSGSRSWSPFSSSPAPSSSDPCAPLHIGSCSSAAVGTVALEAASPSRASGGLALGLAAGAFVRLAFGSAAGVPRDGSACATALAALGVDVRRPARLGAAADRRGASTSATTRRGAR